MANSSKKNINGFLLLDKVIGVSSNKALQQVKGLYQAKKAGHTGSLDPLACGMLPIAFGEATKFSSHLLNADKHYTFTAKLGVKTSSGDAEGEMIETAPVPNISQEQIERVLKDFQGEATQIPPMYSALKHQGQPLYKLARQGIEIERKSRTITLFQLSLTKFTNSEITCKVLCSKGTYIRSLAEDIAKALGTVAHVTYLYRDWVSPFMQHKMIQFEELQTLCASELEHYLLPIETALDHFPTLKINPQQKQDLFHGKPIPWQKDTKKGVYLLVDEQHQFLGLGQISAESQLKVKRLISTKA